MYLHHTELYTHSSVCLCCPYWLCFKIVSAVSLISHVCRCLNYNIFKCNCGVGGVQFVSSCLLSLNTLLKYNSETDLHQPYQITCSAENSCFHLLSYNLDPVITWLKDYRFDSYLLWWGGDCCPMQEIEPGSSSASAPQRRTFYIYLLLLLPPRWSSGQDVWLLIMRSRVRSPAHPQILNVD